MAFLGDIISADSGCHLSDRVEEAAKDFGKRHGLSETEISMLHTSMLVQIIKTEVKPERRDLYGRADDEALKERLEEIERESRRRTGEQG